MISLRLFFFSKGGGLSIQIQLITTKEQYSLNPKPKNSLIQLSKNLISKSQFKKKKGMEKERKQKPQTSSEVIIALICCNHSKQANKRNKKIKKYLEKRIKI
jgi:hypothetical protein